MTRLNIAALCIGVLAMGPVHAATQTEQLSSESTQIDTLSKSKGETRVITNISSTFESFAGSDANSRSLVTGLRTGSEITLSAEGQKDAVFTPPTRPMGIGNVTISLALARQELAANGITNPTPAQLETALMGGDLQVGSQTIHMNGVLQLRAQGMGWGQIAHSMNVNLGSVVSSVKAQRTAIAATASTSAAGVSSHTTTAGKSASGGSASAMGAGSRSGIVTAAGGSPAGMPVHARSTGSAQSTVTSSGAMASAHGVTTAAGLAHAGTPQGKAIGKP
jgi:hypothetical protein